MSEASHLMTSSLPSAFNYLYSDPPLNLEKYAAKFPSLPYPPARSSTNMQPFVPTISIEDL